MPTERSTEDAPVVIVWRVDAGGMPEHPWAVRRPRTAAGGRPVADDPRTTTPGPGPPGVARRIARPAALRLRGPRPVRQRQRGFGRFVSQPEVPHEPRLLPGFA